MQPRRAICAADGLALEASIKVDAHSRCRVAGFHIPWHLRRGVGEIARVACDPLDHLHRARPADLDCGLLFAAAGRLGKLRGGDQHLLLDEHFEGFGHRAALRRIGERDTPIQARLREVGPLRRRPFDIQPRQHIGVVTDPKRRKARADPAALRIPERLPPNRLRNRLLVEKLGMRLDHAARHKPPRISLQLEVEAAAAKKQVEPAADIRLEKCPPRSLCDGVVGRRVIQLDLRILKRRLHRGAPLALPMILESCDIFRLQVARDLARASGRAPIDARLPPRRAQMML